MGSLASFSSFVIQTYFREENHNEKSNFVSARENYNFSYYVLVNLFIEVTIWEQVCTPQTNNIDRPSKHSPSYLTKISSDWKSRVIL